MARRDAEQSKELFEQLGDRATVGRLLNNLAGLNHLLGNAQRAIEQLLEAFEIFVDLGLTPEAGYVFSSLADVHLSIGDAAAAETNARKALELLGDRIDHIQEIGASRLVLGRSLLAQGRLIEAGQELTAAARSSPTRSRSATRQTGGSLKATSHKNPATYTKPHGSSVKPHKRCSPTTPRPPGRARGSPDPARRIPQTGGAHQPSISPQRGRTTSPPRERTVPVPSKGIALYFLLLLTALAASLASLGGSWFDGG